MPEIDAYGYAIHIVKWGIAAFVAQATALAVGSQAALQLLVFLMGVDWLTGFVAAWINGVVSSETGRKGLARKGLTLLLILTVHVVEKMAGHEINAELIGATAYCFNEGVSIIENMSRAGVYIPQPLVDGLLKVKNLRPGRASAADIAKLHDDDKAGN